jgi:hypothetical protein
MGRARPTVRSSASPMPGRSRGTSKIRVARATGINDAGQIVGYFGDPRVTMHGMHEFSRTAAGALTIIGVPGATNTFLLGVTYAAQIVGEFTDAGGKSHGFVTARYPAQCYLIVVNLQDLFKPEEDRPHRVNRRGASVHDGVVYSQPPA